MTTEQKTYDRAVGYRIQAFDGEVLIETTTIRTNEVVVSTQRFWPGGDLTFTVTPIVERVVEVPAPCERECCAEAEYDDEYVPAKEDA